MTETPEKLGIQSVEVAAVILLALTRLARKVALKELAQEAGMPAAKVHRYLVSLVRTHLVSQDPLSGRYFIGEQSILLGLAGLRSLDYVGTAGMALPDLRDRTSETAILAIWTENGPIVVRFEESSKPVYMNVRVGSVLPLTTTATGLAFASHLPEETLSRFLESDPIHSIAADKRAALPRTLEQVRQNRFASVGGDLVAGVAAVAAPIFDHDGKVAAVIGVVGRQEEITASLDNKIIPAVIDIANMVTSKLGGAVVPAAR